MPAIVRGRLRRPSFGLNVHPLNVDEANMGAVLDGCAAVKAEWIRIDLRWFLHETAKGVYNSAFQTKIDTAVNAVVSRGMKVCLMVFETPLWAGVADVHDPTPNVTHQYDYCRYLALRYPQVHAFEQWNEPNLTTFYTGGAAATLVPVMHAFYQGIKAGNPRALVIGPGVSTVDDTWYAAAYAAGAKGSFDAVACHPYNQPSSGGPEAPEAGGAGGANAKYSMTHLPTLYALMVAQGDGRLPIWLTEWGWSTHTNVGGEENWQIGVTQREQATFLVRAMEMFRTSMPFVEVAMWFKAVDNTGSDNQTNNIGLYTDDMAVAKESVAALQSYL